MIGDGLHNLFNNQEQPAYLTLLTGDKSWKLLRYRDIFLSSLQAHSQKDENEIVFHGSRIILNVTDALYNTFRTTLIPGQLFSYGDDTQLRSACLYWQDKEYALREINSNDVVGAMGRPPNLDWILSICGITMPHPNEMGLSYRRQFCFQHPNCLIVYTLLPAGSRYNGRNILGWELGGD